MSGSISTVLSQYELEVKIFAKQADTRLQQGTNYIVLQKEPFSSPKSPSFHKSSIELLPILSWPFSYERYRVHEPATIPYDSQIFAQRRAGLGTRSKSRLQSISKRIFLLLLRYPYGSQYSRKGFGNANRNQTTTVSRGNRRLQL